MSKSVDELISALESLQEDFEREVARNKESHDELKGDIHEVNVRIGNHEYNAVHQPVSKGGE